MLVLRMCCTHAASTSLRLLWRLPHTAHTEPINLIASEEANFRQKIDVVTQAQKSAMFFCVFHLSPRAIGRTDQDSLSRLGHPPEWACGTRVHLLKCQNTRHASGAEISKVAKTYP